MIKGAEIEIKSQRDREDMVRALANSGYKVWVREDDESDYPRRKHFVIFEIEEL